MSSELKSYYVGLQDGYEEGDLYYHKNKECSEHYIKNDIAYEVIRIDACNQLMEVQEIKSEEN
jgi:hypothetical protein